MLISILKEWKIQVRHVQCGNWDVWRWDEVGFILGLASAGSKQQKTSASHSASGGSCRAGSTCVLTAVVALDTLCSQQSRAHSSSESFRGWKMSASPLQAMHFLTGHSFSFGWHCLTISEMLLGLWTGTPTHRQSFSLQ